MNQGLFQAEIEVIDVNDNIPEFESDQYSLSFPLNSLPGSLMGSFPARDDDPTSIVTYKLDFLPTENSIPPEIGENLLKIDTETGDVFLSDDFAQLNLSECTDQQILFEVLISIDSS